MLRETLQALATRPDCSFSGHARVDHERGPCARQRFGIAVLGVRSRSVRLSPKASMWHRGAQRTRRGAAAAARQQQEEAGAGDADARAAGSGPSGSSSRDRSVPRCGRAGKRAVSAAVASRRRSSASRPRGTSASTKDAVITMPPISTSSTPPKVKVMPATKPARLSARCTGSTSATRKSPRNRRCARSSAPNSQAAARAAPCTAPAGNRAGTRASRRGQAQTRERPEHGQREQAEPVRDGRQARVRERVMADHAPAGELDAQVHARTEQREGRRRRPRRCCVPRSASSGGPAGRRKA